MSEIVHCPKCRSAVSVGAGQAGKRVQCPSCSKEFFAPSTLGGGGPTSDDDDWLSLDDSPSPGIGTAKSTPSQSVVTESAEDDIFGEDPFVESSDSESDPLDLFAGLPPIEDANAGPASLAAASPAPTPGAPAGASTPETGMPESGMPGTATPASAASGSAASGPSSGNKAQPVDPNEEFRVTCPICGSLMYAKAKQTGKTIKCSDCYSEIRVPAPPKKQVQPQKNDNAETFKLADTGVSDRPADPFLRSADELLKEAAREPEERDGSAASFDAPSTVGWFKSVFGIFIDPGVIFHLIGLSLLIGLPAALVVAHPLLSLGVIPLGMVGIALSVACGFAILFGVANQHERIEDWPTVDPTGWFESLWLVITATAIAVGPAYVVATVFGAPPVIKIGVVMFSVYAAFPIILLSMLDMQSVTSPFSPDVSKSITRCQEEWGAFYFSAGLLFAGLYGYFVMISPTPTSIAIGVVLSIFVVFTYFAILGRLALAIGNVVNLSALDNGDDEDEESDD